MSVPISPSPVTETHPTDLPAYVSNGLIGIRVLDLPLLPGVVLLSGYSGTHPEVQVDAAAQAPYPVAGDIGVGGTWLRTSSQQAEFVEQRYDFSNGELTTRFRFRTTQATADIEVLLFCSQKQPTIVRQEISVRVSTACDLSVRSLVHLGQAWASRASIDMGGRERRRAA